MAKIKGKRPDINREMEAFSAFLRNTDSKITNQRLQIAKKIFQKNTHFSVEELIGDFRKEKKNVSRATIYRTVSLMVKAGFLVEHSFDQNASLYEYIVGKEHHDHIVCLDCGRIVEFSNDKIEKLQRETAKKMGFVLESHSLVLFGRCSELKQTGKCEFFKKE